jgi:hypothetical protein
MKSIGTQIKQLSALVGGEDLTEWENEFVESVNERSKHGTHTSGLSEKQVEIIARIYRKHFGDSE